MGGPLMRHKSGSVTAPVASSTSTSNYVTRTGIRPDFYLANRPGSAVQYLDMSGHGAAHYMETIRVCGAALDGQTRTHTPVSSGGTLRSAGMDAAVRTAEGCSVTSVNDDGTATEQHFARSSREAVDASIAALSQFVSQNRVQADILSARAISQDRCAVSLEESTHLAALQTDVETTSDRLHVAQRVADHLLSAARLARADANAAIDKSCVRLRQRQRQTAKITYADNADRNAIVGQRMADFAEKTASDARTEVAHLRRHLADASERPRCEPASAALHS
jgi:hypothetical protein